MNRPGLLTAFAVFAGLVIGGVVGGAPAVSLTGCVGILSVAVYHVLTRGQP